MQRIDALQLAINAMILRHVQLSQCRVYGSGLRPERDYG